jgi:hypothetical protein
MGFVYKILIEKFWKLTFQYQKVDYVFDELIRWYTVLI